MDNDDIEFFYWLFGVLAMTLTVTSAITPPHMPVFIISLIGVLAGICWSVHVFMINRL